MSIYYIYMYEKSNTTNTNNTNAYLNVNFSDSFCIFNIIMLNVS